MMVRSRLQQNVFQDRIILRPWLFNYCYPLAIGYLSRIRQIKSLKIHHPEL